MDILTPQQIEDRMLEKIVTDIKRQKLEFELFKMDHPFLRRYLDGLVCYSHDTAIKCIIETRENALKG